MMNEQNKPTPGPWKKSSTVAGSIGGQDGRLICSMWGNENDEETKANVRLIADALKEFGVELLTGATLNDARQGMVDRFQAGQAKVFVGTIKAGGVGITLTTAQTVILVDRPWTPGDAVQAEDRCHRIGQKGNVTAIKKV